jgi:DNA invertase Pin-like site-specific DNA recombinase
MEARIGWKTLMQSHKTREAVTITKIDRAAHSIADMVNNTKELADKGASIRILDMNIDTTAGTSTLMLNIFASVAQFKRNQMLVCQCIGIAAQSWPTRASRWNNAPRNARSPLPGLRLTVCALLAASYSKERIAKELEIDIASVYRILKAAV